VTGYDDEEITELLPLDFVADEDAGAIRQAVEEGGAKQEATLVTKAGERIPYEFRGAGLRDDDGDVVGISGIGRDITERRERERLLEDQAERLSLLNHVNGVIRQVHRVLVRASTRAEVERAVCDNLTDADAYRFAWIGEYDAAGGRAEPRAWAGDEDGYLEDRAASDDTDDVTAATAIENGEMEVIQNVAAGGIEDSWRDAALQRGYRSAAAIPLQYRETTYGVLCVYAPRENAFDERERTVLNELGETIGYAISAAERRRAFQSDILPLFSAGNSGSDTNTLNDYAKAPNVLGVAATNDDKAVTDFSSRGRTPDYDGETNYQRKKALDNLREYRAADKTDEEVDSGSFSGTVGPTSSEFHEWRAPSNAGYVEATLSWDPSGENVDFYLREGSRDGDVVASGATLNEPEELSGPIEGDTTYYFEVRPFASVAADYDIEYTAYEGINRNVHPMGLYRNGVGAQRKARDEHARTDRPATGVRR